MRPPFTYGKPPPLRGLALRPVTPRLRKPPGLPRWTPPPRLPPRAPLRKGAAMHKGKRFAAICADGVTRSAVVTASEAWAWDAIRASVQVTKDGQRFSISGNLSAVGLNDGFFLPPRRAPRGDAPLPLRHACGGLRLHPAPPGCAALARACRQARVDALRPVQRFGPLLACYRSPRGGFPLRACHRAPGR